MSKPRASVKVDLARSTLPFHRKGRPYLEMLMQMRSMDKTELTVHLLDDDPNIRTAAKILIEELDSES